MTRLIRAAALLALIAASPTVFAGPEPPVFGEGACEAPFNLVIPAEVADAAGGLVVFVHDDGSGGRVIFRIGPDALTVAHRSAEAEAEELARAEAPLPAEDGEIVLKRKNGAVAVAYDGVTVLRAEADLPDGGRWGVLDATDGAVDQIMLQPTAPVVFADDFMRQPGQSATWETLSGDWQVAQLESSRYSANAFTLLGRADGGDDALAAAGYWFYEDLTVEASVRPSRGADGFGVGLACQPDGDCYLLRFLRGDGPSGVLQIVRVRGGEESVLDETATVAHADEWHRLALSGVGGRLSGALDGVELVSAEDPTLAHGQVALWMTGQEPVAFDDVQARSGERRAREPVVLSHDAQTADPSAQAFINDEYMQEWADERDQWLPGAGGTWHAGHFWGDVELAWEMTERGLGDGAQLHICVPAGGETLSPPADPEAGLHLALTPTDGQLALALREAAEVREETAIPLPELPATVTLRRRDATVEALVGGKVVAGFETDTPAGGKVGLTGGTARSQMNQLRIVTRNLLDSTFRAAPTDWHIGSGDWGVSSRWDCTPRWSWFQGRSEDLASVWTRRSFPGDQVVEFFAGISMDQPWAPFYQHPGNLCVTLCGDNDTPGSGYSLVFAGWDNSAAGIFRKGELVARATGFTMPDILDSLGGTTGREDAHKLHNEWWRIRAERIGSTVRLLVDGKPAVSFDDPDPLPGGAVGIWTLDQAMTVARARVYYETAEHLPAPPVAEDTMARGKQGLPLPSFGPPRVTSAFEEGTGGWRAGGQGSCEVALVERGDRAGGRCLRITNPTAGGDFGLAAPFSDVDLREQPLLAFDYAVPEDVAIDAFATVGGRRYRVRLSGPEGDAPGVEDIGHVADLRADGRWREARIDLLGLLRPHVAGDGPVALERLEFAAYAVPEYTRAGIGGNPRGAAWRLDNVYLGGATSEAVTLQTPRDVTVEARGCSVDRDLRMGRAEHRVTPRRGGLTAVTLTSGGRWWMDLIAFDVAGPELSPVQPAPDAAWLGPEVSVSVSDEGPAGIDESSLRLGTGERTLRLGDRGLRWDAAGGVLRLDLRAADLRLPPGEPTSLRISASDRAGNAARALQVAFTPDPEADSTPPDPPVLTGLPAPPLDCDFEHDTGAIGPWGADAAVDLRRVRDPVAGNDAGGQWCLEARCTELGGLFGVSLIDRPFDASRYPVLEFDYRAPADLRVDLIVEVDGSRRVIKFTDNDQTWRPIGRLGAIADDQWHHATVDLHALLARGFGHDAPLVVTDLAFATSGWPGNRAGTRWFLDNVRLSAALDVSALPADLGLTSRDESGIRGYVYTLDSEPASEPPADPSLLDLRPAVLPLLAEERVGELAWLHAVAVDVADNRSQAAHIPLRIMRRDDRAAPVAAAPSPEDGAEACPETISVGLTDQGSGVSPADLRLTVGDRTWSVADDSLKWEAEAGRVIWTLPAGGAPGADGAEVTCRLEGNDLAGNALEPVEWRFTIDHAQDEQPPAAPVVSYLPARTADRNDFAEDTGGWGNFVDGQVLRLAQAGASGPGCAQLRHLGGRGSGFVLVRDFGEGWREHPVVRFRYRAENAPRAGLQVFGTTFDGTRDRWTQLGSLPTSGDGWRTAVLDVAEALAQVSPALDIHRIFLSIDLPPDGTLLVDDYAMYSRAATEAAFRWAPPADASGIAGYAWALDGADDTVPPEEVTGTATQARFTDLQPGHHCFHVRACDRAGNWGPTTHVPFDVIAPKQP